MPTYKYPSHGDGVVANVEVAPKLTFPEYVPVFATLNEFSLP